MLRKFHLTDFPKDRVYILLEDSFRKQFFDKARSVDGSYDSLAKKLGVSKTMITKWRKAVNKSNGKSHVQCMPLWAILKMISIIRRKYDFSILDLEKHIEKYQAKGGWPVVKPNLPLVEDERLIRLFFHFAGDGYAGRFRVSSPQYYNTNSNVMKEFVSDLGVFGNVRIKFREDKKRVLIPKVVAHVIKHLHRTDFRSDEVRIPSNFLELEPHLISQGIKALVDDEGTVECSRIRIIMVNRLFLSDVLNLLKYKFPKLAKYCSLKKKFKKLYCLTISSGGLTLYQNLIGFTHDQKKQDLDFYLKIKNIKRRIWVTKTEILRTLNEEKTIKELMYTVKSTPGMIRRHILGYDIYNNHVSGLKELGLVESVGKRGRTIIWRITERGKLFLSNKL